VIEHLDTYAMIYLYEDGSLNLEVVSGDCLSCTWFVIGPFNSIDIQLSSFSL